MTPAYSVIRRVIDMGTKLIIDGNAVYEIDEDCLHCREQNDEFIKKSRGRGNRKASEKETCETAAQKESPEK